MKILIFGDLHLNNTYEGWAENQVRTIEKIVRKELPECIVFLGDVFHHRRPHPEILLAARDLFDKLKSLTKEKIFIVRGNHDSVDKSDNGVTALSLFEDSKLEVVTHIKVDKKYGLCFIPHYEDESHVKAFLSTFDAGIPIFGHFGYEDCINVNGYFNFQVPFDYVNKSMTFLGHLHQFSQNENVTILGTPWSTNFGEAGSTHYYAVLQGSHWQWNHFEIEEITYGVRHYVVNNSHLQQLQEDIKNPEYFTLLRVIMDKFLDESNNNVRDKILKDFEVGYVDLKFQPIFDKKLNSRLSDFDPQKSFEELNDSLIDKYLEEQKSTIPTEILKQGLDKIKSYADKED